MKARYIYLFFFVSSVFPLKGIAQQPRPNSKGVGMFLDSLNKFIDYCVVQKNFKALDTLYAADFAVTNSNGKFIDKVSWLRALKDNSTNYTSRIHDSVVQEVHPDVTIFSGTLTVKESQNKIERIYGLRYIRIFTYRKNRWELLSDITVKEWH